MVVLGTQSKFRAWKWILHTQIDLRKVASTTWTSFTLNVIEANYISALIMVLILCVLQRVACCAVWFSTLISNLEFRV